MRARGKTEKVTNGESRGSYRDMLCRRGAGSVGGSKKITFGWDGFTTGELK